jgi:hypothetical protein
MAYLEGWLGDCHRRHHLHTPPYEVSYWPALRPACTSRRQAKGSLLASNI